jgi:hypothetical protein
VRVTPFPLQSPTDLRPDYAVLAMAVHSALQVFRPVSQGNSDGLYKYRYYLYCSVLLLPGIMASLAFINPELAYLSQGAFCTLPIRPFWYRLALAWIPRYLIAAIIVSLAIAIYAYVGFEFRSYASMNQSFETPATNTTGVSRRDGVEEAAVGVSDTAEIAGTVPKHARRASSIAHDVAASHRRGSAVMFADERHSVTRTFTAPAAHTQSLPGSSTQLTLKRTGSIHPPLFGIPSGYSINADPEPSPLHGGPPTPIINQSNEPPSAATTSSVTDTAPPTFQTPATSPSNHHLLRQRRRIHRQLRLMFIYPLVYALMWLIPFVQHCMMYSDRYAHRPVWFFRIGTTVCITSMGFVDCLIFSLREKPWRGMQTSDGTLWGSFAVWRSPRLPNAGLFAISRMNSEAVVAVDDGEGITVARLRNSVRTSASDDFTRIAAAQARIRLDLEREERLARLKVRVEARRRREQEGSEWEESEEGESGGSKYSEKSEKSAEEKGKGKEKEAQEVESVD